MRDWMTTRPIAAEDLPFVGEMLWEAAAVSAGMRALGMEAALAQPSVRKYLQGWGRPGDAGVVAVDATGRRLSAAWYRLFPAEAPGYGFVAADVPELSIGVSEAARGRGVGGALIDALLGMARAQGFRAVCLSVDRQNPAVKLYERNGFRDAGVSAPEETSVTMIATIT
jgi:ribosomal protein S18 acetylase RimI-like enzyme